MQNNSKAELCKVIDNMSDLNNILRYIFVSDRALGYVVSEGIFDLRDDEISGMNAIKDIVEGKYSNLHNSINAIYEGLE